MRRNLFFLKHDTWALIHKRMRYGSKMEQETSNKLNEQIKSAIKHNRKNWVKELVHPKAQSREMYLALGALTKGPKPQRYANKDEDNKFIPLNLRAEKGGTVYGE